MKNKKIDSKFKITIIILIMLIVSVPKNEFAGEENNIITDKISLGDINNDKKIDSSDLLLLLRHVYASENNKHKEWILTENKFLAGDMTKNGVIDSSDIIAILRYFAASENTEIARKHEDWLKIEEIEINEEINVESISLNKSNLQLYIGESELLIASILPEKATDKTITWSSSNQNVATVDTAGKVTAKSQGQATITAKTVNGKKAECIVKVKIREIDVTNIKLNKNSTELQVGKEETLTATIEPQNATNKTVTWTSSNQNIATVDNGGKVTAKSEGQATITAKTSNGKKAECIVKVKPNEVFATSIKLDKELIELQIGKEGKLTATIEPANTTNKTVTWTSSNPNIATVDNGGKVTAKSEGETIITAKTSNGKISNCKVKVEELTTFGKIMLKNYNVIDTSLPVFIGHKYTNLTQTQIKQIAYLAYLEQGSLEGAKIELSLMANLTEQRRSDYDVYKFVMTSGWFGPANMGMIPSNPQYNGYFTEKYVDLTNEVLVNGKRYLTKNVNEHDCISDISYISTGSKSDRSDYIPNKTIITNVYGGKYVFVGFAPNGGDPFGYTY